MPRRDRRCDDVRHHTRGTGRSCARGDPGLRVLQNTRNLGGAFRPGAVDEVINPYVRAGTGICQMPCPEQLAWGGVLKRRLLFLYGRPWLSPVDRLIRPGLSGYTVVRYRLLARRVARQLIGYQRSGFDVVGVVGVDASPTCGVTTTLDLGPVSGRGRCLPLGPPRPPLHERHRPQWLGGARSRPVHRRAQ
jgi:hypothetical protein